MVRPGSTPMTTWGAGDYPLMAQRLEPVAADVVHLAAIEVGDRVLDVATGTGNAAILAAERGGRVCGVDFEPALLEVAAGRPEQVARRVSWVVGEATALPVADRAADVVLSVFGAMYAPEQDAAAAELARVAARGARVVLASWTPGSFLPSMGAVVGSYLPPPPAGSHPPSRWGDVGLLPTLLEPHGLRLTDSFDRRVMLRFTDVGAAADFLVGTAGHVVSQRQRLVEEGRWSDLLRDLADLVESRAERSDGHLELSLDHLVVAAIKTA